MTTTATVQGQNVRLLGTLDAVTLVADTWEAVDEEPGSWRRTGQVMTVRLGVSLSTVEPFICWAHNYGLAVGVVPAPDPEERFAEALRQEHQRMLTRHADMEAHQVAP